MNLKQLSAASMAALTVGLCGPSPVRAQADNSPFLADKMMACLKVMQPYTGREATYAALYGARIKQGVSGDVRCGAYVGRASTNDDPQHIRLTFDQRDVRFNKGDILTVERRNGRMSMMYQVLRSDGELLTYGNVPAAAGKPAQITLQQASGPVATRNFADAPTDVRAAFSAGAKLAKSGAFSLKL